MSHTGKIEERCFREPTNGLFAKVLSRSRTVHSQLLTEGSRATVVWKGDISDLCMSFDVCQHLHLLSKLRET
jgi:hypothetical protein